MADTIVRWFGPSGLTATLELYPEDSDTIQNTGGDSFTEATNCLGSYTATVAESLVGDYRAVIKVGSNVFGNGWVSLLDTTSTYEITADKSTSFDTLDDLANMLEDAGTSSPKFTTSALSNAPRLIIGNIVTTTNRTVNNSVITAFVDELSTVTVSVVDQNNNPVDMSTKTLYVSFESMDRTDITSIEQASLTVSSNSVSFDLPAAVTSSEQDVLYSIRDTSDETVYVSGKIKVSYAPKV